MDPVGWNRPGATSRQNGSLLMDYRTLCLEKDLTVFAAMQKLNDTGHGALFVVDKDMRILGVVTDGDIRRGLLKGVILQAPVSQVMNTKFTAGSACDDRESMHHLMRQKQLRQLPVVNANGVLIDAVLIEETLYRNISNPVVLMVGGMGTRLRPLTDQVPKPMIKIGDKPILEDTVQRLAGFGFKNFYFAVNYRSEVIENHFADGKKWDVNISYVREHKRLGTAGALALLPEMKESFVVMNGDIVTDLDFSKLLRFHKSEGGLATVSVSQQQMQVQYGVVEFEGTTVTRIVEKPFHVFFINAGVYVLNPECLQLIQNDNYLDMPMLLSQMIDAGKKISAYSMHGYWKDIGVIRDLDQARRDFKKIG